jgi:cytochrome P450
VAALMTTAGRADPYPLYRVLHRHGPVLPRAAAALRVEPGLAPAYVEELLRHDPPVQLASRLAREPVTLPGGGPAIEPGPG